MLWQSVAQVDVTGSSSKDSGSGIAGYQHRLSTDGGTTWSAPTVGGQATIASEGETSAQFRARDRAGNFSAWAPTLGSSGTVRIDRSAPSDPTISGGSLEWQNAASVTVSASGATDAGSGVAGYQYRTSTDGGTSWSAPAVGADAAITAEGETLVEFQALDAAGNASDWQPASPGEADTVRIDHTLPTTPDVTGGSPAWQSVASVILTADGSVDGPGGAGIDHYEYRESTDGGTTWTTPAVGATDTVNGEGETLVAFRAIDGTNLASAWASATVRIDRTAPADPVVDGDLAGWQSVPSETVSASGSTDNGSGVDHYEYRESTDGGATWSTPATGVADLVSAEGQTLVAFRALDGAGNASAWIQRTVAIDRTEPTAPTSVAGGSATWQNAVSVMVSASGASDAGSGLAGYEYRTSTDNGATWSTPSSGADASISSEGETLVEFRAVDGAGNVSDWTPIPPDTAGTVRIDRTAPSNPNVTGGSVNWQSTASITISGAGSTDTGGSGLAGYQYRTSTNNGASWSAAAAGTSVQITTEGTTLVQFRSLDNAGNASAWSPASIAAANTAKIDRTAPTATTISGGATACAKKRTIKGSGSTDALSGVDHYEYRYSTNGGAYSAPKTGAAANFNKTGTYTVQFRAFDRAGNTSSWAPATNGPANTACIR